jgi:hypothetical protein
MARAKLQLRRPTAAKDESENPPAVTAATAAASTKERRGQGATSPRPDRQGTRLIAGHFPKTTWAMLRDLGTRLDKKNQELLQEALDDLFAKHRQRGH